MSESERDQRIKELDEKNRRIKELEEKVQKIEDKMGLTPSVAAKPIVPAAPPPSPLSKWPVQRRWAGIFKSPGLTMTNIAGAPDYAEPGFIVFLEAVLGAIAVGVAMGKMQLTGPYAGSVRSMVSSILVGSVFLAGLLMFVFWAIRAWLVMALCKRDSDWQFKSAAAVTGYAMIPGLFVSIVALIITASVLPTLVIDTSSLEAAEQAAAAFSTQTDSLKLSMTLPLTLVGNVWQAYLGGHGVQAGTRGKCPFAIGFVIFFIIGLLDIALIFI